jgi:hypothetical protein
MHKGIILHTETSTTRVTNMRISHKYYSASHNTNKVIVDSRVHTLNSLGHSNERSDALYETIDMTV